MMNNTLPMRIPETIQKYLDIKTIFSKFLLVCKSWSCTMLSRHHTEILCPINDNTFDNIINKHDTTVLRILTIRSQTITSKSIQKLSTLNLKFLNLSRSRVVDNSLSLITSLQILNISSCGVITDAHLENISKLTNLYALNLSDCTLPKNLKCPPNLRILNLNFCKTTLNKLPPLYELSIKKFQTLTYIELYYIFSTPTIQILDLSWNKLYNAGLAGIRKLKNLQKINLEQTNATDYDIDNLPTKHLTYLNLGYCERITSEGLRHISKMSGLQYLNLLGCESIINDSLYFIRSLKLIELDIGETKVTDEGLKWIKLVGSLEKLGVSRCEKISSSELEKLVGLKYIDVRGLGFSSKIMMHRRFNMDLQIFWDGV